MSFFSKFPRKAYSFPGSTVGSKITVDITKRVILRSYAKNNQNMFIKYKLKQHESYEDIAYKLYNRADYHWILLLINEIIDPFYDLPMTSEEITNIVNSNYSGYSIFFAVNEFMGNFIVGESVRAYTATTDTLTGNVTYSPLAYTATVTGWNSSYRELSVTDETNLSVLTMASSSDSIVLIGDTSDAKGTFKRRVLRTNSLHHFEDSNGNILNPYDGHLTAYVEQAELAGVVVVSNMEYEETTNDAKRNIHVIRPEYIEQINRELSAIFSTNSKNLR